ncbi:MAG: hypothetical protein ACK587_11800 [Cyanobacteriota bacterium]
MNQARILKAGTPFASDGNPSVPGGSSVINPPSLPADSNTVVTNASYLLRTGTPFASDGNPGVHGGSSVINPPSLPADNDTDVFAASFVVRISKSERRIIDELSSDYAESIVTVLSKSLRLYSAIVEASQNGGSLLMATVPKRSLTTVAFGRAVSYDGSTDPMPRDENEAIIAVRDQFADRGKTPIRINRIYISAPKGFKTERITIKADLVFMSNLSELEGKTGLNKSSIMRDGVQLYNYIKRESEKNDVTFYVGSMRIDGI